MKLMRSKGVISQTLLVWVVGLCLALTVASVSWAQDGPEALEGDWESLVITGPFDGLDVKSRKIWINDMVYNLVRGVKVKGTASKLGLLSDLKQGEEVKVTIQPNEKTPNIPNVVLIERQ